MQRYLSFLPSNDSEGKNGEKEIKKEREEIELTINCRFEESITKVFSEGLRE